ncbi:MAG: hypothetical protein Q7J25_07005, partial [Vicinamibacterales bacterium]|nr:hypothetical protein [Vicinamibacterales bacterium]
GPVAGVVATLFLFSLDSLLHEHGLRSNNMEAVLLAVYAGGMYHAIRWAETAGARTGARHALALAGWFTLAFLTKFVAALFLPLLILVTLALKPGGLRELARSWRGWGPPAALSALAISPWFIYQSLHTGPLFWETILTAHVVQRFAGVLDPEHVHPWHYYASWIAAEVRRAGLGAVCLIGGVALIHRASGAGQWRARAMLAWFFVPVVLLSAGTSKLFHYIYPFLPPLGIGVGVAAATWLTLFSGHGRATQLATRWGVDHFAASRSTVIGRALTVAGALVLLVAGWTLVVGQVLIVAGGKTLLSNSYVWRPAAAGLVLWFLAGRGRAAALAAAVLLLVAALLPARYPRRFDLLLRQDHPLRTTRDCVLDVERSGARAGRGIYHASGDLHHAYYYYLRRLEPWTSWRGAAPDELHRRLEVEGQQTPVILARADYLALGAALPAGVPPPHPRGSDVPLLHPASASALPPGVLFSDDIVLLFPGPFSACVSAVAGVAVDATPLAPRVPPPAGGA